MRLNLIHNENRKVFSFVRVTTLTIIYIYLTLVWPVTFNFTSEPSRCPEFSLLCLLVLLCNIISESILKTQIDLIHLLCLGLSIICNIWLFFFEKNNLSNEHFWFIVSLLSVLLSFFPLDRKEYEQFIFFTSALCFVTLVPVLYICITGAQGELFVFYFKNSGVYSIFISLHLPFFWYTLTRLFYSRLPLVCFICYLLLFIFVAGICIYYKSRTGVLIACLSSFIIVFQQVRKIRSVKKITYVTLSLFVVILFIQRNSFFTEKMRSVDGRILSYKIAFSHAFDNLYFGVGIGNLPFAYPQWQAKYFETSRNSTEILASGELYNIFNEPLLLFIEVGLIKFLLISIVIILYFLFQRKSQQTTYFVNTIYFICFLVSSIFYYTLHISPLIFICLLGIGNVFSEAYVPFQIKCNTLIRGTLFGLLIVGNIACVYFSYKNVRLNNKWRQLRASSGSIYAITKEYMLLYPQLKQNGKFLYEYAEYLSNYQAFDHLTIKVLRESLLLFNSYKSIELLAILEKRTGNIAESIRLYTFLTNYLPYKYRPRRELMYLYQQNKMHCLARKTALSICELPVKVNTEEATQIIREAQQVLSLIRISTN